MAWLPLLALAAVAGTWIGKRILQRVPQSSFRKIALGLVFATGWLTLYGALAD